MKKNYFFALLASIFVLLFSNIVLAQDEVDIDEDPAVIFTGGGIEVLKETTEETTLTMPINAAGSELKGVEARFCNDGIENLTNKLTTTIGQMEIGEICVLIKNDSENDVKTNLVIKSQVSTDGTSPSCSLNQNPFAEFVNEPTSQVFVPAGEHVIKKLKVQFPLGVNGMQGGCLSYNVERANAGDQMVNIVVSKSMLMDFFVGEVGDITKEMKLTIIDKRIVNNELIIDVGAKNVGNIDLMTNVNGSLSNMFGIKKDFELTGQIVRTQGSLVFTLNFGQLPNYKGLFNIDITAKHTPHFDFDTSSFDIDPDILAEGESSIKTIYFEMPWIILGTALVIIILLILAFRKPKQKVVYVENKK